MTRTKSRTCSFEGCDKPHDAKGLCSGHWHQQRKGQTLRPIRYRIPRGTYATCSVDGCDKPHRSGGLCKGHHTQKRRGQELRPLRTRKTVCE